MAKQSTANVFNQCFQYKILTQILPTQEYLLRYQVDGIIDNVCKMCKLERCTIEHSIYECISLQPFLRLIQSIIKTELNYKINFCRKTFLFGKLNNIQKYTGLNHFLIETKKFIFYDLRNSELLMQSLCLSVLNLK